MLYVINVFLKCKLLLVRHLNLFLHAVTNTNFYVLSHLQRDIQAILLPDRQTLRGDRRHKDKHY